MLERCLLFYGMRMGKTKIALDWASQYKAGKMLRGKGLVIAHAPIGVDVWEFQSSIHSELQVIGVRSGPNASDALLDALEGPADLIVMSWSTMQGLFTEKREVVRGQHKGQLKLYPDYKTLRMVADFFDLVIIDEIHKCKNHMSLWFTIASELVQHCRFRLGLTGTPIGRDPLAIWAQAFLIDGGQALSGNYYFFEQAFGKLKQGWGRMPASWSFDKSKMPILNSKLASLSLSYKLEDVQKVEVLQGVIELRMSPAQRKAYEEVLEKVIERQKLGEESDAEIENNFVQLRQIASGFTSFTRDDGTKGIYRFPNSAKLVWLKELADDLAGEVQIVIFHEFVHSGEAICELLTKAKIKHGWLYGGTKDKGAVIKDFQAGKSRWLVANSASGSMAIDLPMADYLLFFECPTSPITRAQAEARPLSRGSKPLLVDDMICAPVENKILGFIKEGKSALSSMLNAKQELGLLRKRR